METEEMRLARESEMRTWMSILKIKNMFDKVGNTADKKDFYDELNSHNPFNIEMTMDILKTQEIIQMIRPLCIDDERLKFFSYAYELFVVGPEFETISRPRLG
jgi:hypothetical protein